MTNSDVWDAATAARYDETSAFMFTPEVLDPAVAFLADLAGEGAALEFAIGTGRLAIPLAERGVAVSGIELSQPMVDQLHQKGADIPVVVGDMATSTAPGEFSLVYVVWNSIANLRTQAEQVACFANAARQQLPVHLASRVRSDGPTGHDGAGEPQRGLARCAVHQREREPHLGLAQVRLRKTRRPAHAADRAAIRRGPSDRRCLRSRRGCV